MKIGWKKLLYAAIFMAMLMSLNLYYIWDTQKKFYEIHQCGHQLENDSVRNLKEIKHAISNSGDREKLELIGENLELRWQNQKLMQELLNMFGLLRGKEMPLNKSSGKTNI